VDQPGISQIRPEWHNARGNIAVKGEPNTSMKTPLIHSTSVRSHVSHACVIALLATLAGCAHGPTRYSRADLDIIPASDVPADVTPPMAIRTVTPVYPYDLRRLGLEGSAEVLCLIDENGTVQNAGYLDATDLAFADSAIAAAKQWSFAPGTRNGTRVPMHAVIPFRFAFEDDGRQFAADKWLSLR
jgi:TonB family protein